MNTTCYKGRGTNERRQVTVKEKKIILGDVFFVDDGRRAEQLLQLLGLEGLRETLQRHQQELQLLRSVEG